MKRLVNALAILLLVVAVPDVVEAGSPTKTPDFSAEADVAHIAGDLATLWDDDPGVFRRIEAVRTHLIDVRRRGGDIRRVDVARKLAVIGDEALVPMLWRIAADDPMESGMDLRTWRAWRIGLLEAVGRLRDERSLPVLETVITGADPHSPVRQVATSALGRVGDDESLQRLVEYAETTTPRRRKAIVAGLGDGRRMVALDYLLERADESSVPSERRAAIRSLGDWANQWAWETSELESRRGEGRTGRQRIIRHLVEWFPEFDKDLREEAVKSLQLAGSAEARARVRKEMSATDHRGKRGAWSELFERLADAPLD